MRTELDKIEACLRLGSPESIHFNNVYIHNKMLVFFDCLKNKFFIEALNLLLSLDVGSPGYYLTKYIMVLSSLSNKKYSKDSARRFKELVKFTDSKHSTITSIKTKSKTRKVAVVFGQIRDLAYTNSLILQLLREVDEVVVSTWSRTGVLIPHNQRSFESLFTERENKILKSNNINFDDVTEYGWNLFNSQYLPNKLSIMPRKESGDIVTIPSSPNLTVILSDAEQFDISTCELPESFKIKHINQLRMAFLIERAAKSLVKSEKIYDLVALYRSDVTVSGANLNNIINCTVEVDSVSVEFVKRSQYLRIGDFSYYGGMGLLVALSGIYKYLKPLSQSDTPKFLMPHNWLVDYFIANELKLVISQIQFHGKLLREL